MDTSLWSKCLERLEGSIDQAQFNTWIRPLHAVEDGSRLRLLAPNQFVLDRVRDQFFGLISDAVSDSANGSAPALILEVG